jgi:hypothetical protein
MAEESKTQSSSSSSSSSKRDKRDKRVGPTTMGGGGPVGGGLAPIQGEYQDDRPAEERPGTSEHLGSDRPYEGDASPLAEGDDAARNR